jgi:cell division protease FtsH
MAPANVTHQYLDGQAYLDCSQETSALVDKTVKNLLDKCYNDAVQTLTDNRALLNEIAEFLLIKETITGEELMTYVNSHLSPSEPTEE